jgi:pimeloyl-ACP methyl ester carboxylesterase
MSETRQGVLYGDLLACNAFNVTEQLGQIHQPALVICGEEDRMTPLRYSQFLAERLPGASLQIVPDAGHMVMLEKPQQVAEIWLSFLRGLGYL